MQTFQQLALEFTQALTARDYSAGYAMIPGDWDRGKLLLQLSPGSRVV